MAYTDPSASMRSEQRAKASSPIFITEGGRVMLARLEHSPKAPSPISVT